jgi:hypothetical protein
MAKRVKKSKASKSKAVTRSSGKGNPMFWLIVLLSLLIGIVLARWNLHFVALLLAGIIVFVDTWRRGVAQQPAGMFGKQNNYGFMLASGAVLVIISLTQLVTFAK